MVIYMLSLCVKSMHPICKSVAMITLFVLIIERLTGAALTAFMALVDIGIVPTKLHVVFFHARMKTIN